MCVPCRKERLGIMNNPPVISVIVPIYKAEPYLRRCVNSIRNQTYTNLEIILVDDGSPDKCGEICDSFAKEDSRIRVFHKENGGQSSARNLGLDNMTGEYVGFVDSDDWIEADMYQRLYALSHIHDAQIVCCGIQKDYPNGRKTYFNPNYPVENDVKIYTTMEALEESLSNCRITYSPCDKLYDSDVFQTIRMTEGKIYEDMEMIPKCIEKAETVVYDPHPYYHYNLTEHSTIRGVFNYRRFAEADVALSKAVDYRLRYPELYDKAMGCYISICLNIIHVSSGVPSCVQQRKQIIVELRSSLYNDFINELNKKDKIKIAVLRISPIAFEMMMNAYDIFIKIKVSLLQMMRKEK